MWVLILVVIVAALGPNHEFVSYQAFDKITAQADCQAALAALSPQPIAPVYAGCVQLPFLPASAIVQPPAPSAASTLNAPSPGSILWGTQAITFGPNPVSAGGKDYPILIAGNGANGGAGAEIAVANGNLYAATAAGVWYQWSGSAWGALTAKPAGVL